jgi:hypothetical protein
MTTPVSELKVGDVVRGLVIPYHYESRIVEIVGPFRSGEINGTVLMSYRLRVETRGIMSWRQTSGRTIVGVVK